MATSRLAVSSCPACTASYTATESVWVRPGRLPATIKVAPNSPSERANTSSAPARMPGVAIGSVIRKKTAHSPSPSTLAAFSSCGSTASNAVRADFSSSGKATSVAAITAPCQVKISWIPKAWCSQAPSQPRRPITTSR